MTVKSGNVYSGIFFGASADKPETEYLLKMVQLVRRGDKDEKNGVRENTNGYVGVGQDYAMSFKAQDVVDISLEGVTIGPQHRHQNGMLNLKDTPVEAYSLTNRLRDFLLYRLRHLGAERRPGTRAPALGASRGG